MSNGDKDLKLSSRDVHGEIPLTGMLFYGLYEGARCLFPPRSLRETRSDKGEIVSSLLELSLDTWGNLLQEKTRVFSNRHTCHTRALF